MKKFLFLMCLPLMNWAQTSENRITSIVDSTDAHNIVLIQSFAVKVDLDSVWNAYTTKEGWESWVAPKAEIDWKPGGTIKTNYRKNGQIGDEETIVLKIIGYANKRLLTLQAELGKNFPNFMIQDQKYLYNTIVFKPLSDEETEITSFGMGYKNNKKYKDLMKFFIQGNEASFQNLTRYLETGKPTVK